MNKDHLKQMAEAPGFIGALDQSGGSTPKALKAYGIEEDAYKTEEEMFELVHNMRTRMITSDAFNSGKIIGVILFERTMRDKIEGLLTSDFLWQKRNIVPFLKVDKGLEAEANGVQLMKPFPELGKLLDEAVGFNVFGTKMRSVIKQANAEGIKAVVEQQFAWAKEILSHGLMPIIEPEVDINCPEKELAEAILKTEILAQLDKMDEQVMLKVTIPTIANFYKEIIEHPKMLRVVALSGGYPIDLANELLAKNNGMIASFSRALAEGLSAKQSDEEFNTVLQKTLDDIYAASIS